MSTLQQYSKKMTLYNPLTGIQWAILALHLTISILGASKYPGSVLYFLFFSTSFLVLILQSVSRFNSPTYSFFGVMLWFGFFCKALVHLILKYPFVEPIGNFSNSPPDWDRTLLVASIGALGGICAKALFDRLVKNKKENYLLTKNNFTTIPAVFVRHKYTIYFALVAVITFVAIINVILGINLSGLAAVTILPWPLNATIGWLLYIGFAICVAQVLNWEYATTKTIKWGYLISIFEGLASSVSIISRGLFLFHTIPIIGVSLANTSHFNIKLRHIFMYSSITLVAFFISSSGVTLIRTSLFDDGTSMYDFYDADDEDAFLFDLPELQKNVSSVSTAQPTKVYSIEKTIEKASAQNNKFFRVLNQISNLAIDRWIGIEGVMAVTSYPEKSLNLLIESLLRKPKVGELDVYEKISKSIYQPSMKYSFASIPGPIAFFYYSNSFLVVFFGVFIFTGIMFFTDIVIFNVFNNCFLSAQLAFYLANSLAQFGISPRPLLISFLMTTCALVVLNLFIRLISKQNS